MTLMCIPPDDGDVCQPKHVEVTFVLVYTGAISWNKFLSVWFKFNLFFLCFFESD
jgi:hypothetical protein